MWPDQRSPEGFTYLRLIRSALNIETATAMARTRPERSGEWVACR